MFNYQNAYIFSSSALYAGDGRGAGQNRAPRLISRYSRIWLPHTHNVCVFMVVVCKSVDLLD